MTPAYEETTLDKKRQQQANNATARRDRQGTDRCSQGKARIDK
jgi:hypothetical protein